MCFTWTYRKEKWKKIPNNVLVGKASMTGRGGSNQALALGRGSCKNRVGNRNWSRKQGQSGSIGERISLRIAHEEDFLERGAGGT